jgi:molybdopterin-containing oxidoreductase family iron-sulfur binding subunit
VWDSWAELHPETANHYGIKHGDIIKISSEHGTIQVKAYLMSGIHPDAISVPLGQGHTDFGSYASGIGVNPLSILSPDVEQKTGELALYSTKVKIEKTSKHEKFVRLGAVDTQMGRKLVSTVSAATVKRDKGV